MEWSGQPHQTNPSAPQPGGGQAPAPSFYGVNPLQPQPMAGQPAPPLPMGQGGTLNQAAGQPYYAVPPQPAGQAVPAMPGQFQPAAQQARTNDDMVDADDAQWVVRAKRAVASTQGDPHRKVQLIQHLRAQYLRQRYGRTVHTDEA